jgi:hypothetical protein
MKKLFDYLKIGLAAVVKFTAFPYASQITIGAFGVVELLAGHKLLAVLITAWGAVLAAREYQLRRNES